MLRELQLRHVSCIAFECLDPFLGVPVDIDPAAIQAKLVRSRRGGYCHEHNSLFHDVLAALGFSVTALAGRVLLGHSGRPGPGTLTHRLTLVQLAEGRFVADVGFGGQSPTTPICLEPGLEQATLFAAYRLVRNGDGFALEMKHGDRWQGLYRFDLAAQTQADFEVANWFTSTHPRSPFTQNLMVSRVLAETRVNLLNTSLSVHHSDGSIEQRSLADAGDLAEVLNETMGLTLPAAAEVIWTKIRCILA